MDKKSGSLSLQRAGFSSVPKPAIGRNRRLLGTSIRQFRSNRNCRDLAAGWLRWRLPFPEREIAVECMNPDSGSGSIHGRTRALTGLQHAVTVTVIQKDAASIHRIFEKGP